jgi:hypothetical protein
MQAYCGWVDGPIVAALNERGTLSKRRRKDARLSTGYGRRLQSPGDGIAICEPHDSREAKRGVEGSHAVWRFTFVETRRDPATGEPVDVDKAFGDVIGHRLPSLRASFPEWANVNNANIKQHRSLEAASQTVLALR